MVLAFLLLTLLIMHRLVYSLLGLSFMAIRNNEVLAGSVGINTFAGKILSFVVANFFAGLAGGIYASLMGTISPSTASLELTFNWLIFLLLGGAATLAGPIIGAFVIPVIMEYLQFLAEYRLIIFGALLIVVIIYFPRGVMGAISNLQQKARDFYERKKGAQRVLLQVKNLSKHFAGLVAVNDISFEVREGEILSIVGPNGAGKSVLFGLISGMLRPTYGQVLLQGEEITGFKPHRIARSGNRPDLSNHGPV